MNSLVKRRKLAMSALDRARTAVRNVSQVKTEMLENRLKKLDKCYDDFNKLTQQLYDYESEVGFIDPINDMEEYENIYFETHATLAQELAVRLSTNFKPTNNNDETFERLAVQQETFLEKLNRVDSGAQLMKIKVPTFSGNYKDWPSFRDLFLSAVVHKQSLTNVHRFHHLKSCLAGDALQLIQHLAITEENYTAAWDRLTNRYDLAKSPNAVTLRKISDGADEVVRGLDALKASQRDPWLIQLLLDKVDEETKRAWAEAGDGRRDETLQEFLEFLAHQCDILEAAPPPKTSQKLAVTHHVAVHQSQHQQNCVHCSGEHNLSKCDRFLALDVEARRSFVKANNLCYNCLSKSHRASKCTSTFRCKRCRGTHHTLVHFDLIPSSSPNPPIRRSENLTVASNHSVQTHATSDQTLLPTVLVDVIDTWGRKLECRALLDSGSTVSFVTESFVTRTGQPRRKASISVVGLSACSAGISRGRVMLTLCSKHSSVTLPVDALVLPKITSCLPNEPLSLSSSWNSLLNLPLADPSFSVPGLIDILLGADVLGQVYTGEYHKTLPNFPVAMNTIFGWAILGPSSCLVSSNPSGDLSTTSISSNHAMIDLDHIARLFLDRESIESAVTPSQPEDPAEHHFATTHTRDADGSYIVSYPFKDNSPPITHSLPHTLNRLRQMERRFRSNSDLRAQYVQFLNEYQKLGHMERVPTNEINLPRSKCFYLAHHAVLKPDSSTTKCRVVFDGSCKDESGVSLNDRMHVGPPIQRDLFGVMLRFRLQPFVFTADIEKMFRGIKVSKDHQDLQRIVWRENESSEIEHYRLLTVTYGLAASPFLAVRVLKQLSLDYKDVFPEASRVLLHDVYVDDILTGCNTITSLLQLKDDLIALLSRGNFSLRKWSSNCWPLIESLPPELRQFNSVSFQDPTDAIIKVLGLEWNPSRDDFSVRVGELKSVNPTKRLVLSEMSKIYDPLGIVAPTVVLFKTLFQDSWYHALNWDDPLPDLLAGRWCQYIDQLHELNQVKVPRYLGTSCDEIELHGFSDASSLACAAVIYSRFKVDNGFETRLVAARTRVAPLKTISIPRLELNAAVLLTRLLDRIVSSFTAKNIKFVCWTDSEIVLHWLSTPSRRWQTFVCNRVSEISEIAPRSRWRHVSSEDNPADCASRGMLPSKLVKHQLWWNGPSWLTQSEDKWPAQKLRPTFNPNDPVLEERKTSQVTLHVAATNSTLDELINKISSWLRLVRVLAYCRRFGSRCRGVSLQGRYLTTVELQGAQHVIVRHVQKSAFGIDIQRLEQSKELQLKSNIIRLLPFLDTNHILRVGGRIKHATLNYNIKHPIVLPKESNISLLIVRHIHLTYLHPGVDATFVILRQRYWILGSRRLVRKVVFDCKRCFMLKRSLNPPLMGDLPAARVQPHRCFLHCGLDYAGPVTTKFSRGRRPALTKSWIAIFVCMSTKAIHIEMVSDLTTEAFMAAFRRFVARRGKPTDLYSDNGTTFKGGKRVLSELHTSALAESNVSIISELLANDGITWHFIPPSAPHFGGLWEAGVRSIKLHLRRVIGDHVLTFEEYYTVLTQIEAILNSRPLCSISDDDLDPLTPAHFLIGCPYTSIPEPTYLDINCNRLQTWRLLQAVVQGFWKRWHAEYLTSLQHRPKWQKCHPNLKVGDLVVLKEPSIPPAKWVLGRIQEVTPGADGAVRVAKVKTSFGEYTRPAIKLVPLPGS